MAEAISRKSAQHGVSNVGMVRTPRAATSLAAAQYMVSQNLSTRIVMVFAVPRGSMWGPGRSARRGRAILRSTTRWSVRCYGSLSGLPPTYVYSGSTIPLAQQAVVLETRTQP